MKQIKVSLSGSQLDFIKDYKQKYNLKNDAAVIKIALDLLERQTLYKMFGQMAKAIGSNPAPLIGQEAAEDFLDDSWWYSNANARLPPAKVYINPV